jgi:hypothetical protein
MPNGLHLFDFILVLVLGESTRLARWMYGTPERTSSWPNVFFNLLVGGVPHKILS